MAIQGAVGAYIPRTVVEQSNDRLDRQRGVDNSLDSSRQSTDKLAEEGTEKVITAAEQFLNSIDEVSAYIAQIRHQKNLAKQVNFLAEPELDFVLEDEAHEKIDRLIPVLKGEGRSNARELLLKARELFPDSSCRIAALRVLLRRRAQFDDDISVISEALAEEEKQVETKPTRAGINVALKARLYGRKLKLSPASVRTAYRDFIQSEESELALYEKWVMYYGAERRHFLIDFMEKALLTDIEASDPSCNDAEFGFLFKRLSQVKLIRSGDLSFINAIKNNEIVYAFNKDENKWLLFLIAVLTNPDEVYGALNEVGGLNLDKATVKDKAKFIQSVYVCCKVVTERIYSEPECREILLQNLRDLLQSVLLQQKESFSSAALNNYRLKA